MSYAKETRARGLVGVRADATDPKALLAQINGAFEEFKTSHNAALKQQDVVQTEKVDRINATITDLGKELDKVNSNIAALKIGGGAGDGKDDRFDADVAIFTGEMKKMIPGLVDALVEAYQGQFDIVGDFDVKLPTGDYDMQAVMQDDIDWMQATRDDVCLEDQSLLALLDNIVALYQRTAYKLKRFAR